MKMRKNDKQINSKRGDTKSYMYACVCVRRSSGKTQKNLLQLIACFELVVVCDCVSVCVCVCLNLKNRPRANTRD